MSYIDRAKQRAYQTTALKRRRREWIAANGPCQHCGSTERLEVDHIDPETRVTHAVWSWSKLRRDAELAKCQVLCHDCHVKKTREDRRLRRFGRPIFPSRMPRGLTRRAS